MQFSIGVAREEAAEIINVFVKSFLCQVHFSASSQLLSFFFLKNNLVSIFTLMYASLSGYHNSDVISFSSNII